MAFHIQRTRSSNKDGSHLPCPISYFDGVDLSKAEVAPSAIRGMGPSESAQRQAKRLGNGTPTAY